MEMENPFFVNRRWYPKPDPIRSNSYHPIYRVDPIHESAHPIHRPQERNSGTKVVRVPVHFLRSEQVDRTGSAVKIQKVFRGFLVRKCLKKVEDIRVEVDEIEEKLWKSEVVELVRREEKERLRINEILMSLLFKLDSICGMDFGVRGCRKAVIRKVIALQERIDAIAATDLEGNCEIGVSVETENSIKPGCSENNLGVLEDCGENLRNDVTETEIGVSVENENSNPTGDLEESGKEADIIDVRVDCEVKASKCNGDLVELDDDNKRNRELMEKMIEESEKMRKVMNEMCERNEMQTKMLSALTNRVEMLEKAFVCDRLRRKKKKPKLSVTSKDN